MLKKDFIESKIKKYFNNIFKNDLMFFDFLSGNEKKYFLKYFNEEINNLDEYINNIKVIFFNAIKNLDRNKIYNLITLIKENNIFEYSRKNLYQINYFFEIKNLDKKILNTFFTSFFVNIVTDIYITCKNTISFFNKHFDYNDKLNIYGLEKNIKFLKEYIYNYYDFFINFYIYLLNKKDKDIKYIFPFYETNENKFIVSVVDLKEEEGGAEAVNASEVDIKKIKNILSDMENNNNNIKNYYTKNEIQKLETVLENKKINKLINNNNIKLSKDYKSLINSVVEDKNIENPDKYDKYTKSKEFFNNLFVIDDKENNKENMESLYEIFINEPDKKKFIDYLSDKIYYNNYLNKDSTHNTNHSLDTCTNVESLKKTTEMLAVFDKVLGQILNTDLKNNTLKLSSDDVKFILMLEVLNTLKQNVKEPSSDKNITLNVFKEIQGIKINEDDVKIN